MPDINIRKNKETTLGIFLFLRNTQQAALYDLTTIPAPQYCLSQ